MPLHPKTSSSLASFKSRLVLPFWYRRSQVVLEKRSLNGRSSETVASRRAPGVGAAVGCAAAVPPGRRRAAVSRAAADDELSSVAAHLPPSAASAATPPQLAPASVQTRRPYTRLVRI